MISWQQTGMIIAILLIVLGPKKLPKVTKEIGKTLGSFRKETQQIKDQVDITKQIK
ncbi:MAG TPA: twin-arginine translocase TatA/TatE family subunit [Thermodesulfobium narugense]|uniref:Sec-independent protein translocase protein TatA/sec-independent protein translocase protein TatB n=1 Tax=Thermodesulfobium acidiphilum TaxID=1794699 RepID=A0A2R4W1N6_THEAF|nr:twin-arginine translocase TatA/TatE family subunit [Thermodesulfobium acidiphilum]AWB10616.1 sec-independent protein translocase protein TatA/sec-independent protein translocase protein TatB [Thermodesulfobium acidiphilum]HEM56519.1 twin-arginine translocase TatA/TatE family subunit [Thermodesulfobium narugense]